METDEESVEPDIFRLVYSSAAKERFSKEDLLELLEGARANNTRLEVSGILLYDAGTFFQVLEGDQEVVESLFSVIEKDDRHDNTLILLRETGPREFSDWSMGFVKASPDLVAEIQGLNDFFRRGLSGEQNETLDSEDRTRKILEQFRKGRWRREIEG